MKLRATTSFAVISAALAVHTANAAGGARLQVGTCAPAAATFTTIGAAVAAAGVGKTIYICPGVYPEQVVITHNLALVGLSAGGKSQARIIPPPGGLVGNTFSLDDTSFPIAAQILAQNATVSITGLTIDGTGNQISGCSPDVDGILFQNASGAISANYMINQNLVNGSSGLGGCQSGEGIYVESNSSGSSIVTITNNHVQDYQKNGITANDAQTTATITGNTVVGIGATPLIAQNGIQVGFGTSASVTYNTVADDVYTGPTYGASGILVFDGITPKITNNTVSNTQGAIYVYNDTGNNTNDGLSISSNRIATTRTFDAIDVCGIEAATIGSNLINGSDQSAIHVDSGCSRLSSATLTANRVNGACSGVLVGVNSTATVTSATFVNAVTNTQLSSDVCPLATGQIANVAKFSVRRPAVKR